MLSAHQSEGKIQAWRDEPSCAAARSPVVFYVFNFIAIVIMIIAIALLTSGATCVDVEETVVILGHLLLHRTCG